MLTSSSLTQCIDERGVDPCTPPFTVQEPNGVKKDFPCASLSDTDEWKLQREGFCLGNRDLFVVFFRIIVSNKILRLRSDSSSLSQKQGPCRSLLLIIFGRFHCWCERRAMVLQFSFLFWFPHIIWFGRVNNLAHSGIVDML